MAPARAAMWLGAAGLSLTAGLASFSGAGFTTQSSSPGNSLAAAGSFCSGSTQTIHSGADSFVDQDAPDSNLGSGANLFVSSKMLVLTPKNRRSLVSFDLPPMPASCSVTDATLRLYATSAVPLRTIEAYRADASWTESGVTWNNRPGTAGSAAAASSGTGWVEWDVTAQVGDIYSGTSHGFLLRDSSEDSLVSFEQEYQSREGTPDSRDPELEVTFG